MAVDRTGPWPGYPTVYPFLRRKILPESRRKKRVAQRIGERPDHGGKERAHNVHSEMAKRLGTVAFLLPSPSRRRRRRLADVADESGYAASGLLPSFVYPLTPLDATFHCCPGLTFLFLPFAPTASRPVLSAHTSKCFNTIQRPSRKI